MSTHAPYSNAWREHTLARMRRNCLTPKAIADALGMPDLPADLRGGGRLSLEVVGPVDEYLEALDRDSDVRQVHVSLDPLVDCTLAMWGER